MENGKWKMENGKLKIENGKWKMENGKWKVESRKWKMENLELGMELRISNFNYQLSIINCTTLARKKKTRQGSLTGFRKASKNLNYLLYTLGLLYVVLLGVL